MISEKAIKEYKDIFESKYKRKISDKEAREGAENLLSLVKIIVEQGITEQKRKERLKIHPKGFHLDENEGTYNCIVCHRPVSGLETWWDRYGTKCLDCQQNLEKRIIPKKICRNRDLYFRSWKLKSDYGLHPSTVRMHRRQGLLKGIDLKSREGVIYDTIFLIKDNQDYLANLKERPGG